MQKVGSKANSDQDETEDCQTDTAPPLCLLSLSIEVSVDNISSNHSYLGKNEALGPHSVISFLHLIIVRWLVLIVAINGISIAIARGLILKVDVSFFNPSREPCYELAHYETNLNNYFKSV